MDNKLVNGLLLIIPAVLLHLFWNFMVRKESSASGLLWWVLCMKIILFGTIGIPSLIPILMKSPHLCGYMAISALGLTFYYVGLRGSYRRAPITFVYPVVRSSPLFIALAGMFLGSEMLSTRAWIGCLVCTIGLIILSFDKNGSTRSALPYAFLALSGTMIYSLSDKASLAELLSPQSIAGFISINSLAPLFALTLLNHKDKQLPIPPVPRSFYVLLAGGIAQGGAYLLTILAMRSNPASVVVACTNTGIVLSSIIAIVVFKERDRWKVRLFSALLISAGITIMVVGMQ